MQLAFLTRKDGFVDRFLQITKCRFLAVRFFVATFAPWTKSQEQRSAWCRRLGCVEFVGGMPMIECRVCRRDADDWDVTCYFIIFSTGTPGVSLVWKAVYCLSCMANSLSWSEVISGLKGMLWSSKQSAMCLRLGYRAYISSRETPWFVTQDSISGRSRCSTSLIISFAPAYKDSLSSFISMTSL